MSHPHDMYPWQYGVGGRPDVLDLPRLILQAGFAVLVHARAELERKVWAEPRPFAPPGCGHVVHHYRYCCLPGRDGQ
jgi:hypothetical protein